MPLSIKDNSAWKTVNGVYVKDSSIWKTVQAGFIKNSGVWKQFYSNTVAARILVVGGGGSGAGAPNCTCGGGGQGYRAGGGGGGGGFIDTTQTLSPNVSYSVGVGGAGVNSTFNGLISYYGGAGGSSDCARNQAFAGSPGGGSGDGVGGAGGNGGNYQGSTRAQGQADGAGTSYSDITGINSVYRVGGPATQSMLAVPTPSGAYGSGGRGGLTCGPGGVQATGGIQGVVILRFPSYRSASTTGSVSTSTAGTDSVYTFTGSGTITFT